MSEKEDYHVVSFSGGKDSTCMLLLMLEDGMHIDEVVYCDTGMEFPAMVDHVNKIEKLCTEEYNVKFTRLKHDKGFKYMMLDYELKKGDRCGEHGYGWPRPRSRWCTGHLKTKLVDKHFSELQSHYNVIRYIGIAYDEPKRIQNHKYPLVDKKITEDDAIRICKEHGYDWGGLYDIFHRVSCWCCPLQPMSSLKSLRRYFPELWEELLELDSKTYNTFKIDYSAQDLEERFAGDGVKKSLL